MLRTGTRSVLIFISKITRFSVIFWSKCKAFSLAGLYRWSTCSVCNEGLLSTVIKFNPTNITPPCFSYVIYLLLFINV